MKRFNKIYVEITNICNLHCSFCPGTKRAPEMMELGNFKRVIREIFPYTDFVYLHLMGEPLMHPELYEFLKIIKDEGLKCCLTTNGTLLSERRDELLRASDGIHKISISLQAQEANSGQTKQNLISGDKYLDGCFSFAKSAEKSTIVVLRLWNRGGLDRNNDFIIEAMKKYYPSPWMEHPLGYRIGEKTYLEFGDKFDWPDIDAKETNPEEDRYYCYGLKDQLGILADGRVVPCCLDNNANLALGNIFEDSLEEILSSERATSIYEGFRRGIAAEELCKRCGFAKRFIK